MRTVGSRSVLLLVCSLAGLPGCVPVYLVAPRGGQSSTQASAEGVTLTAYVSDWLGDPPDLDDYATPVAVDIANVSTADVQVTYADFALTDARGRRYPALHPFVDRQGVAPAADRGVQLAYRGSPRGHGWGPPTWRHGGWHHGGWRYGGWPAWGATGWGWHGGPGVHLAPGVRFYFGASLMYWGGPFWYPPGYWTNVYPWGPPYASWGPSRDVLDLALPEAVLRPGGRMRGFLYFQRVTAQGSQPLELSWLIRDAHSHAVIREVRLPLVVVRR
jgi:hypothetical protein